MTIILMNSENSKTSSPHSLVLNLTGTTDLQRVDTRITLLNISIYYRWKNIEKT